MSGVFVPLYSVAFGDLAGGIWGAAWGGSDPVVVLGAVGHGAGLVRGSIEGAAPEQDWWLRGEELELALSPAGEFSAATAPPGFDQLCRVRGSCVIDGTEQQIDSLGRRGVRAEVELRSLDSVRDVSAWFEPLGGLALTALRPRDAAGHEDDIVSAALFEADAAVPVADPRLSTTYDGDEQPQRVSLELWLEQDEDEQQYPRRAAGEMLGPAARSARDGVDLQARAVRWHSQGMLGAGVYMLVRPA